jgi:hypothetical protein
MSRRPSTLTRTLALALPLAALSLLTTAMPATAHAGGTTTRLYNDTGRTITVYWRATGCAGLEGEGSQTLVCRSRELAHGQSDVYTFPSYVGDEKVSASCVGNLPLGVARSWGAISERTFSSGDPCGVSESRPARAYFKIVHSSGKCLDVAHADGAKGRGIGLWKCEAEDDQTFYWDGSSLRNAKSDLVVDVAGGTAGNNGEVGDPLLLWDADGGNDQKWSVAWNNGYGTLMNNKRSLCLSGDSSTNAVKLAQCSDSASQKWARVDVKR